MAALVAAAACVAIAAALDETPSQRPLFWHRTEASAYVPVRTGCEASTDPHQPLSREGGPSSAGLWAPVHFLSVRDGEYVIIGRRPQGSNTSESVVGDVLWSGNAGVTWFCLGRNDSAFGGSGSSAWAISRPTNQGSTVHGFCIAGGRRPQPGAPATQRLSPATRDVACTELRPRQMVVAGPGGPGSGETVADAPTTLWLPPVLRLQAGAPLPVALSGACHVRVPYTVAGVNIEWQVLVAGWRADGRGGMLVPQFRSEYIGGGSQDPAAAAGSGGGDDAEWITPVGWKDSQLDVVDSGGDVGTNSSESALAGMRRIGGLPLWLPHLSQLLLAGRLTSSRGFTNSSSDTDADVSGSGAWFGPDSPAQAGDPATIDVTTGTSLDASWRVPVAGMQLLTLLPALTGTGSLTLAPIQPVGTLPVPRPHPGGSGAHALQYLPPSALKASDPSPPSSTTASRMLYHSGGEVYELALQHASGLTSSQQVRHLYYNDTEEVDAKRWRPIQPEALEAAPAGLVALSAWTPSLLAALGSTAANDVISYGGSGADFPHLVGAVPSSGAIWRGTFERCDLPTCPLSEYPAVSCVFSPRQSSSVCAPCWTCDYEPFYWGWCGMAQAFQCVYRCSNECELPEVMIVPCGAPGSVNASHSMCGSDASPLPSPRPFTPRPLPSPSPPSGREQDGKGDDGVGPGQRLWMTTSVRTFYIVAFSLETAAACAALAWLLCTSERMGKGIGRNSNGISGGLEEEAAAEDEERDELKVGGGSGLRAKGGSSSDSSSNRSDGSRGAQVEELGGDNGIAALKSWSRPAAAKTVIFSPAHKSSISAAASFSSSSFTVGAILRVYTSLCSATLLFGILASVALTGPGVLPPQFRWVADSAQAGLILLLSQPFLAMLWLWCADACWAPLRSQRVFPALVKRLKSAASPSRCGACSLRFIWCCIHTVAALLHPRLLMDAVATSSSSSSGGSSSSSASSASLRVVTLLTLLVHQLPLTIITLALMQARFPFEVMAVEANYGADGLIRSTLAPIVVLAQLLALVIDAAAALASSARAASLVSTAAGCGSRLPLGRSTEQRDRMNGGGNYDGTASSGSGSLGAAAATAGVAGAISPLVHVLRKQQQNNPAVTQWGGGRTAVRGASEAATAAVALPVGPSSSTVSNGLHLLSTGQLHLHTPPAGGIGGARGVFSTTGSPHAGASTPSPSANIGGRSTGDIGFRPRSMSGHAGSVAANNSNNGIGGGSNNNIGDDVSSQDLVSLLGELWSRARTAEGRRLAGMRIFFRSHPQLLPAAVEAVQQVPLPERWMQLLQRLETGDVSGSGFVDLETSSSAAASATGGSTERATTDGGTTTRSGSSGGGGAGGNGEPDSRHDDDEDDHDNESSNDTTGSSLASVDRSGIGGAALHAADEAEDGRVGP